MMNYSDLYCAGTTAIVYNFKLDYKENGTYPLGITTQPLSRFRSFTDIGTVTEEVISAENTGITEIGISYAKAGEGVWHEIKLSKDLEAGKSFTFDDLREAKIDVGNGVLKSYFWNSDEDPVPTILSDSGNEIPKYQEVTDDPDNPMVRWGTLRVDIGGQGLKDQTDSDIPDDLIPCEYLLQPPIYYQAENSKWVPRLMPYRVVILGLTPGTRYIISSYYKKAGVADPITFNAVDIQTMTPGDIEYNCTEVLDYRVNQDPNKEPPMSVIKSVKMEIKQVCAIFNSMTAFTRAKSGNDALNSKNGGSFTAKAGGLNVNEVAGTSEMQFSMYSIYVVTHEMAHNLMYIWNTNNRIKGDCKYEITPYIENCEDSNAAIAATVNAKIKTFMEFATNVPNLVWRWQDDHNYPMISSMNYSLVDNFIVAAACYALRTCVEDD